MFLLLIGGWTLASASLHVVRTPGKVLIIPKDRVGFRDTYVDTRAWTLESVSQHPSVSARLVHLDRASLLSHVITDNSRGEVRAQLIEAIDHPQAAPPSTRPAMVQKVTSQIHAASRTVRSIFN